MASGLSRRTAGTLCAFWNRYMSAYEAINRFDDYTLYLDEIVRRLPLREGDCVLDAGSGTGNLALRLRDTGIRTVGLDFSAVAQRIHREKDPGAQVLQASLEEPLPFRSGTFDGVACLSVLFALSQEGACRALREFRRVLRPGGWLVLTSMRPDTSRLYATWSHIHSRWRTLSAGAFLREMAGMTAPIARILYHNWRMRGLARHDGYRRLSSEKLIEWVEQTGFTEIRYGTTFGERFHLLEARAPAKTRTLAKKAVLCHKSSG